MLANTSASAYDARRTPDAAHAARHVRDGGQRSKDETPYPGRSMHDCSQSALHVDEPLQVSARGDRQSSRARDVASNRRAGRQGPRSGDAIANITRHRGLSAVRWRLPRTSDGVRRPRYHGPSPVSLIPISRDIAQYFVGGQARPAASSHALHVPQHSGETKSSRQGLRKPPEAGAGGDRASGSIEGLSEQNQWVGSAGAGQVGT